jgi:hypothetical protein
MGNEIIISNSYYSALRENDIIAHYKKYKTQILKEIKNQPVIFFIATKTNTLVVRRRIYNSLIYLFEDYYEQILHGRILSISYEIGAITNIWFVDIDPGKYVKHGELMEKLEIVVDTFNNLYSTGYAKKTARIFNTASGFHVEIEMKNTDTVNNIKNNIIDLFEKKLEKDDTFIINKNRRNQNETIIDLSSLNRKGSRLVPYALARNGLMCMDITNNWKKFRFENAIIKTGA